MNRLIRTILFISLLGDTITAAQGQTTCTNSNFSLGNFDYWTGHYGTFANPAQSTGFATTPPARHLVIQAPGTPDPYGATGGNGDTLYTVYPGDAYSARLGNDVGAAQSEQLSYDFTVSPSTAYFVYRYAIVLNDPGHMPSIQPSFMVKVIDMSTGQIYDPVNGYLYVIAQPGLPGWHLSNTNGGTGFEPVRWKNWTTFWLAFQPSDYGKTMRIEFTTKDCSQGGHFGYSYVSARCDSEPLINITGPSYVGENSLVTYTTEPGMLFYDWDVSGGGSIVSGSGTNTITVHWQSVSSDTVKVKYTYPNGCPVGNPAIFPVSLLTAGGQGINADGSYPSPSAMLDIKSTNRGVLIPRISSSSRNMIPSPATGLLIYNTTTGHFNFYNGSAWHQVESTFITSTTGTVRPGGGVLITTIPEAIPDSSAMLDVNNSTRGVLIPRTSPGFIASPSTGLIIYDTATDLLSYYDGSQWKSVCAVSTGVAGAGGGQEAAGVSINSESLSPHPSSMLDISSASRGVLIPRLTTAQRNQILPATGLAIYNSSVNALEYYNGSGWYRMNTSFNSSPAAGNSVPSLSQIVWNWNPLTNAAGYKWNTTNDYNTAVDMGEATTRTETGLICNTSYTRYVWAYSACGFSDPTPLTSSTSACLPFTACGQYFTINHVAGTVAPVSKSVNYGTVDSLPGELVKCWLTNNLGSGHQATAVSDSTEASAGWYWQFNRLQGYRHNGTTLSPAWTTTWIDEDSDWLAANDPCTHELGTGWRIPTRTEWENVDNAGGWTTWNEPWSSALKLHAAGHLNNENGGLSERGVNGNYWSTSQDNKLTSGWFLHLNSAGCYLGSSQPKAGGLTLRCIRD